MTTHSDELNEKNDALFASVSALLFEADPVNIACSDKSNPEEYEIEARTILPRLPDAASPHDVAVIVHEEFCYYFDEDIAGPQESYTEVAEKIWASWCSFQNGTPK
jgi:hypothetical protein